MFLLAHASGFPPPLAPHTSRMRDIKHFTVGLRSRMSAWLWITLLLLAAIAVTAPQQLTVSLYKLSLITSAAWVGYWIDRGLFPYARPDAFLTQPFSPGAACPVGKVLERANELAFAAAQLRRAIVIAAAMIGVALGA